MVVDVCSLHLFDAQRRALERLSRRVARIRQYG
jgi:hypothetical protein